MFLNFCKFHRKTTALVSLFNKVTEENNFLQSICSAKRIIFVKFSGHQCLDKQACFRDLFCFKQACFRGVFRTLLGMIHKWRPWKLSNFQDPHVHLRPKFFHCLDLGCPVSNEPPPFQMITNHLRENMIQGLLLYVINKAHNHWRMVSLSDVRVLN